jgi:hypothetical protein
VLRTAGISHSCIKGAPPFSSGCFPKHVVLNSFVHSNSGDTRKIMDRTSPTSRPPYVPPRRKPVPSNSAPSCPHQQAPAEPLNNHGGLFEVPSYQNYPPPPGAHTTTSPPFSPGQYQNQSQNQGGYAPHSRQYPPQGQWDPNRNSSQQYPGSPGVSKTLKSFGSFMKSALKTTLDPNNMYGNGPGVQSNAFTQHQPGFGQLLPPQPSHSYSNNTTPPLTQVSGATIVNGMALDAAATSRLQMCGVTPMPGRYW